jgi:hypothetical protein
MVGVEPAAGERTMILFCIYMCINQDFNLRMCQLPLRSMSRRRLLLLLLLLLFVQWRGGGGNMDPGGSGIWARFGRS